MTVHIERHDLSGDMPEPGELAVRLDESVAEGLELSAEMLPSTFGTSTLAYEARCVVDPVAAKAETWDAVVTSMQIGSAMFAVTQQGEGTVECRIAGKMRTLEALGPRTFAHSGSWLSAFYLAAICREQDRMTQLCHVPIEGMRALPSETDEVTYLWIDTLQTYWLQRPGLVEKLTATFEASTPTAAHTLPRDLLQGIIYPPINLFYRLITRDHAAFNTGLEEALRLHKTYWTLTDDRRQDIDGAIALAPLAMAGWAFDGDFPLKVESEYLPKHLLQHSWLGEYPT
ncbi:immunity 49 family protein [Streptomyces sp. NPDC050418]|uniref:immunity 49 family protein n=1 Tax=Streptomyces sp. NPDC050418 TaxID=3365612 RepID=UPI0037B9B769